MDIWDKTVREMTKYSVIVENAIDKTSERDVSDKTIKEKGAVYDFISGLRVSIAGSPAHNADKNSPTAFFKFVSKLRMDKIVGGVLLSQKMTPQILSKEKNKQKLIMLIWTFFNRLHGYHVQYFQRTQQGDTGRHY